MNCYQWKFNVSISTISITADISYEEANVDPELPPITVTITGTQSYDDVGPPYSRKFMRCGIGADAFYASRFGIVGYQRFQISGEIGVANLEDYYPLEVSVIDAPTIKAGVFDSSFNLYPRFPTGLFKPWKTEDPAFVCADGVWRKSTNVTKGYVRILTEEGALMAYGFFDRIESGGQITYYRPDDLETSVGTGIMSYEIQ